MFKGSNPTALGFAGVTLLFGVSLVIADVQTLTAAEEMSPAAHFGVTGADLGMNDDDATGSIADKKTPSVTETESGEFIDYTLVFPSGPEADGPTPMRLAAPAHD